MFELKLIGSHTQIAEKVSLLYPEVGAVLADVRARVAPIKPKREIYEYQAACLYALARQYDDPGKTILEIGTALGYSASILGSAAPSAKIITLNPREDELVVARQHLKRWPNVRALTMYSQECLEIWNRPLDMIFVDGDHKNVVRDLPWWNWLRVDGLMIFHDYSPENSGRPCPPVYEVLNAFGDRLGRDFDVLVVDDERVGLAGWYKQAGDAAWNGE